MESSDLLVPTELTISLLSAEAGWGRRKGREREKAERGHKW